MTRTPCGFHGLFVQFWCMAFLMEQFIPHIHTCEVKLCRPKTWEEYCPLEGNLSETQDECEDCPHFITIDFDPDNPLCMREIVRIN